MTLTERKSNPQVTAMLKQMLTDDEMGRVNGGQDFGKPSSRCRHRRAFRTGKVEKNSFLFISWDEDEYYCPDCGEYYFD